MVLSELSFRAQFTVVSGLTVMLGFIGGAVFGPPDPFTQVLIATVVVGIGLALGYVIVYQLGLFESEATNS